jgi:hypothetical protein
MDAPDKATPMANAALRGAVPDATERLAALVEDLALEQITRGDPA